jgi:hypothetical protein
MISLYVIMIFMWFFLTTKRKNETTITNNDEIFSNVLSY